jgi:hypothetical protein
MFSCSGPTDNIVVVLKRESDFEGATGKSNGELNGVIDKDATSQRLEEIYKRLDAIDAYSAESRAATILAVSSQIFCNYHWLLFFFFPCWISN